MDICTKARPVYKEVKSGHFCACHLYNTEEESAELLRLAEEEEAARAAAEEKKISTKIKKKFTEIINRGPEEKKTDEVENKEE